jgi:hypothetical protein
MNSIEDIRVSSIVWYTHSHSYFFDMIPKKTSIQLRPNYQSINQKQRHHAHAMIGR